MAFETFNLGDVLSTAEAIKGARRQSKLDELREISARQQIDTSQRKGIQDTAVFDQEQQIENTRLLNAAAAEIASDPSSAQRWIPMLQNRGVLRNDIDWQSAPPETLRDTAKQIFKSTSASLGALRQSTVGGASMVQSTFQGQNGNAWVMTRDGRAVDTGVPMQKFAPQARDVAGGVSVFDPNIRDVTSQLSTQQQEVGAAAAKAGAEQTAKEQAEIAAILPKAKAERTAQAPQRAEKVRQITGGIDSTMQEVDKALNNASFWTTGIVGSISKAVPGTPAYDLGQTLLTIKANLGFDRLQAMREASPTGGALGQVAVQELQALQATVASLEQLQSEPQLRSALRKIQAHYTNWKEAVVEANKDVTKSLPNSQPEVTATGPNGQKLVLKNGQWQPLQ